MAGRRAPGVGRLAAAVDDEVDIFDAQPAAFERALHDGRAEDPVLRRLTLCLLGANPPLGLGGHSGAAAPGADDPARSLFAVARILELHDFNGAEARAFLGHLPRLPRGQRYYVLNGRLYTVNQSTYEILDFVRAFSAILN